MIVLGISAFYHDSAAALVRDGEIIAAAQEERFTRRKHDEAFPAHSISYCLSEAGVSLDQVDYAAFYDKPLLTFNRLLETYLAYAPHGLASFVKSIPIWMKEKILQKDLLLKGLNRLGAGSIDAKRMLFGFHHHSHAASAFYTSPFERAAILVMDGVGEWATTSLGRGSDHVIDLYKEIRFPHSLGMLYSAFTYYLGFRVNEGEYKVMGLAPYGEPTFRGAILDNLIDLKADGSFRLNMDFFNYCTGLTMTNGRFDALFGGPPRKPDTPLSQRDMNLARSVQEVIEEAVMRLGRALHAETGEKNLCMAGGVALNCVANGRLLREGPFERIWIQPAAGDAGAALGVALSVCHTLPDAQGATVPRRVNNHDAMRGGYLGPGFSTEQVRLDLARLGATYVEYPEEEMVELVASALANEEVVGWFQGRMEFGPRALGNRSILGDPRSPHMQRILNLKIKYRESFRPFAPAVLREDVSKHFALDHDSPYMLIVAPVQESRRREIPPECAHYRGLDKLNLARSDIPAVTHVDYSARVQTVHRETNPLFHRLISAFKAKTGYGLLINTSFNIRDEPIVCSPEDAYRCFMGTEMDMLVIGNIVIRKSEQW